MIVLQDNFNTKLDFNTVIALGSFDGIHSGHLSLINKAVELAASENAKAMVNTFSNHPLTIIDINKVPKLLMDNSTKIEILEELGIDVVNFALFNETIMKMSPEEFILNMINFYNAVGIVVGFNHRFGFKNSGDIVLLEKLSKQYNFKLCVVDPIKYDNDVISSTRIRNSIFEGNVEEAKNMLLRPHSLKGKVVAGKQIGRTLGFPTANLEYSENWAIPKKGVYYTIVEYKNNYFKGITNVGNNPTIGVNLLTIETYILDFDRDIYGENIKISFIKKIRDEVKFNSLSELISQLEKDKNFAQQEEIQITTKI